MSANPYAQDGGNPFQGDGGAGGGHSWYDPGAPGDQSGGGDGDQQYSLPGDGATPALEPAGGGQPQWGASAPPSAEPHHGGGGWVDPAGSAPTPGGPGGGAPPAHTPGGTALPGGSPDLVTAKFWTIEFYQQFFDVDTEDVLKRMGNVMLPLMAPDFLADRHWHMGALPGQGALPGTIANAAAAFSSGHEKRADLYGPLWISTSLWVLLAIVGNIMSKIAWNRRMNQYTLELIDLYNKTKGEVYATPAPPAAWNYDFTKASLGAALVYTFVVFMAFLVWALMKWKNVPVGLTDCLCLYGYSMFAFILTAIMCAVPIDAFQWLMCVLGLLWTSAYLLLNMWQLWKVSLDRAWFTGCVLLVLGTQLAITLGFKYYFFHYQF